MPSAMWAYWSSQAALPTRFRTHNNAVYRAWERMAPSPPSIAYHRTSHRCFFRKRLSGRDGIPEFSSARCNGHPVRAALANRYGLLPALLHHLKDQELGTINPLTALDRGIERPPQPKTSWRAF